MAYTRWQRFVRAIVPTALHMGKLDDRIRGVIVQCEAEQHQCEAKQRRCTHETLEARRAILRARLRKVHR